jgi:cytochrome c peroxidase
MMHACTTHAWPFCCPQPVVKDYAAVRAAIAKVLDADGYDDGSYGPVLVRLAWHASGTFDKASGSGGSNGATMRWGSGA